MNPLQRKLLLRAIFGALVGLRGLGLFTYALGWLAGIGLMLVLWGNNIQQRDRG